MSKLASGLADKLFKLLVGDDIFISYSRADGATYAAGLADKLALRGFSCRLDQWGTESGSEMPESLKKALRRSAALVLVGTKGAALSRHVGDEVREFKRMKRMVIPVAFDGVILKNGFTPAGGVLVRLESHPADGAQAAGGAEAVWAAEIEGLPISCERQEALSTGEPSEAVLNRIEKTCTFWKKDKRLRITSSAVAMLLAGLVAASVWAGSVATAKAEEARLKTREADAAQTRAAEQQAIAVTKTQEADAATERATRADTAAKAAEKVADEKTKLADKATQKAAEQTRLAAEKTRLAAEAAKRAERASAEAAKQQSIAAARRTASDADERRAQSVGMDKDWAEPLRYGTLLSLEAERRLSRLGVSPAEAQESLRDSLNLLPREVVPFDFDYKLDGVWLTPDGRYLITKGEDGFLRSWDAGSRRVVSSVKVEGDYGWRPDLGAGFLVDKDSISIFRLPDFRVTGKITVVGAKSVQYSADGESLAAEVPAPAGRPAGEAPTSIVVWDARDGRQLSLIRIKDQLNDFALSDDHAFVSASVVRQPPGRDGGRAAQGQPEGGNYIQLWPANGTPDAPLKEIKVPLEEEGRVHTAVSMLSFSPDGSLVAGSTSYHAVVVNTKSGEIVRIGGPDRDPEGARGSNVEELIYVGFSPDGKLLGTMGDDATMQTWDARSGEQVFSEMVNKSSGGGVADGPYFTMRDDDGGLRLMDVRTGKEVARVVTREEAEEISYAPEAGRIAFYTGEARQARVYHIGSAQHSASLSSRARSGPDISPDGRYVALGEDRAVVVWDAVNAREVARLRCAAAPFGHIRFSRHGKYVAAAIRDNSVHVWETETGKEVLSLKDVPIEVAARDEDGGGDEGGGDEDNMVYNIEGFGFSPRETFFTLSTQQQAATRVWNLSTGKEVMSAKEVGPFSHDERFVLLTDDTNVRVVETFGGKQLRAFPLQGQALSVSSHDQRLLFTPREGQAVDFEFSPDNKLMAVHEGKTVEVSEIASGRVLYKKSGADEYLNYKFSPDGKYLAIADGGGRKDCQIFKAETGARISTLPLKKDFSSFDFSPDGKLVWTFTWNRNEHLRGEVDIWEAASGRHVLNCGGLQDSLRIHFSPDGRRLAVTDANVLAVRVFDLRTGRQEEELLLDRDIDRQMFSRDGKLLAVSTGDRVRVWEVGSWRELARLKHKGDVELVNFNPSDGQVATVSRELAGGKVTSQVWVISERELLRRACEGVGRNLNPKEWQYSFGREEPGQTCTGLPAPVITEHSGNR